MVANSKIEWCHHTFNPWWGCQRVSPGCERCYAETFAKRVGQEVWGPAKTTSRRFFGDRHWTEPYAWDAAAEKAGERHRVFCASMADVFEDNAELIEQRERLFILIATTPNLDWLLLTKRPQNILPMIPEPWTRTAPRNVWYGTSVEDQQRADERIPFLLRVPAIVRFLSCEPLLGPVDLTKGYEQWCYDCGPDHCKYAWASNPCADAAIDQLSWVIAGGESGANHRPMDLDWARSLRDVCQLAGVAFHFKQIGGRTHSAGGRLLDGRTWDEYPQRTGSHG